MTQKISEMTPGTPPFAGDTLIELSVNLLGVRTTYSGQLSDILQPIQLKASAVTANSALGALPANGVLLYVVFRETAGHAVSVGIGTTSGASDVLSPQAIAASSVLVVPIEVFSAAWFSAGSNQNLFLSSAVWGAASVNVSLVYIAGP